MTPFIEIRTVGGVAYLRLDAIELIATDEWGKAVVHTTGGVFRPLGETPEQFKTRLRIAVVPAPREEGENA